MHKSPARSPTSRSLTQSKDDLSKVGMGLSGGEFLLRRRLEQILQTGHAVLKNEIEFAFGRAEQVVEQTDHVAMIHFAQQPDLHTHVVLAVGDLS